MLCIPMAFNSKIEVKQELIDPNPGPKSKPEPDIPRPTPPVIELSSSDSDDDSSSDEDGENGSSRRRKKQKKFPGNLDVVLPPGFLDPLPPKQTRSPLNSQSMSLALPSSRLSTSADSSVKQFWKAGDYEGASRNDWNSSNGGMDRVRVHPRFLHSNATSHKWVLGAFAELLDNSLDEICNGATYVNLDMVKSKKDGGKMLLIEDNGGGMDPDKMRHCMSLGYSAKSKIVDTIGQYGNGFKTSTMRLGADVIVFSRCRGKNGKRSTQSIGLLSYTFLRSTQKEDIVVPMLDYERSGQDWNKMIRASASDWNLNVDTIVQWSPFSSEADLLRQFHQMQDQGTKIIVYNLWEDDQGLLELDFDTDPHDIQIRGVNRDEKNIEMAQMYPNSRHFLTYRHSLRSYAAILYLRIPPNFRIILRGEDVEHHNIVNDMMMSQEITYRPQAGAEGVPKDSNMVAVVTVGFVKDARAHIDVQGFNVYHKNRLIKPFWRVWHPPGSDGRGVIGVLEANFVEPAHDKQGFERTTVLARLETKLVQMQKIYWTTNCHKIGYAPRRNKKALEKEATPDFSPEGSQAKRILASSDKRQSKSADKGYSNGHLNGKAEARTHSKRPRYAGQSPTSGEDNSDDDSQDNTWRKRANGSSSRELFGKEDGSRKSSGPRFDEVAERPRRITRNSNIKDDGLNVNGCSSSIPISLTLDQLKEENHQLKEENRQLRERLKKKEEEILGDLLKDLQGEKERCKSLEAQLKEANRKNEELANEQESLVDIFSEERQRREISEDNYRKKLKEASSTIQELLDKMKEMSSSGR